MDTFSYFIDNPGDIHTEYCWVDVYEQPVFLNLVVDRIEGCRENLDQELSSPRLRDAAQTDGEFSLLGLKEECFLLLGHGCEKM